MRQFITVFIVSVLFAAGCSDSDITGELERALPEGFNFGIDRRDWSMSSIPEELLLDNSLSGVQSNRAKAAWYNPYEKIDLKEIFPEVNVTSKTINRIDVLTLKVIRDSKGQFPEQPWCGIMRSIEALDFGLSYFNIWIKGDAGTVTIDIGAIDEDVLNFGILNSEDLVNSPYPNGVLDPGEDIGLDMVAGPDGEGEEPFDDDWLYLSKSTDYSNINGTEGNGSGEVYDQRRIPDTEDLNNNGILDTVNNYFSYVIQLDSDHPDAERYLINQATEHGWKQYRINFNDYTGVAGNPDISNLRTARIWLTGLSENQEISIY